MNNHELMLPKSVSKISKIIYVLTASKFDSVLRVNDVFSFQIGYRIFEI